jgi:hypothetical protein
MWFDSQEYQQTDNSVKRITDQCTFNSVNIPCRQQPDKPFHRSIQLTIEGNNSENWYQSYIDDMKPCFTAVQFTQLNIDCTGLPIGMLIEIIRLLPNLHSLQVSSLSLAQLKELSFADSEMLLLVSITNKITKVKLNKMDEIEQIHFLMDLCPRMQYLEVGCTTENQLETIIGCISVNNMTRILYLRCLCLCIPNADEKMVQKLNKIIDFERLFSIDNQTFCGYVIQRQQNQIFLNWELL